MQSPNAISPNARQSVLMASLLYEDKTVTGILEPSNTLTDDGDIAFCAALVTLTNGQVEVHLNIFTDSPCTLKRGTQVANFTVMTPEQMKYVKPIDPVNTWHLLHDNPENAVYYARSLINSTKREEKLNPQDNLDSRKQFLNNFDWTDSMLQPYEIARIEDILVEFHDIFARHRFDIGMNEDFKVKLTPKDGSPAYSSSLLTSINLKEDILVELALLHCYGISTTLPFSKYASPIFAHKKLNGKLRHLVDLRKIINLMSDEYNNNNHPVSALIDAAEHMSG